MARTPAETKAGDGTVEQDAFVTVDPAMEREVAAAIFKKHGFIPQAVGEDSPGKLAGEDSKAYWNATNVTQVVYRRGKSTRPIHLVPGDCVVGAEFRRFTTLHGGPLSETRPDPKDVKVASKRDSAFFSARGRQKGEIAKRYRQAQLSHPDVLPPPK